MYNKRKYNRATWWSILLINTICNFVFCSCKKFVDVDPPVNQILSDQIFQNDGLAISAVTGMYSEMMRVSGSFAAGEITFYAGMSADELVYPNSALKEEFVKNSISPANSVLETAFWLKAYNLIYTANVCLEKMNSPSARLSDSTKRIMEGECKFVRAFCYFNLVNLFGDVPLPMESDFNETMTLPRVPISKVYELIITDLEKARDLLKDNYPSPERVRPNKYAVLAFLSRVYLYRNEWSKAEQTASQVIGNSMYGLESYKDVFGKSSIEAIWQLLPVNPSFNTWEGNTLLTASTSYYMSDTLLHSFEPNDKRKDWYQFRTVPGNPPTIRYFPAKYKVRQNQNKTEYYMVFRLAEQYLIRAEARTHLNKLAEAASDLNIIRNRAVLPNTSASTQLQLYSAIAQERKIELFAEWGHRWYDLKRTQKADEALSVIKFPNWSINDTLWPIPSSQIRANSNLIQNTGY